jgi:hypothetical protein
MKKHLTDQLIGKIVELLDHWEGPLSWPLLCEAVEKTFGQKYSRQTLSKYLLISDAFSVRKQAMRENKGIDPIYQSKQMQDAAKTIEEQKRKIERLEKQINSLLEKFLRWSYNATHATRFPLTEADLDRPLPPIDRR